MRGTVALTALILGTLAGCNAQQPQGDTIHLPEGDAEEGKVAFASLGCTDCHSVKDVELPQSESPAAGKIVLGGQVSRVKTYGELVTSIVNPSHKLARGFPEDRVSAEGQSLMRDYNDLLTVNDVVDIAAFLQSTYQFQRRPGYRYRTYKFPPGGETP